MLDKKFLLDIGIEDNKLISDILSEYEKDISENKKGYEEQISIKSNMIKELENNNAKLVSQLEEEVKTLKGGQEDIQKWKTKVEDMTKAHKTEIQSIQTNNANLIKKLTIKSRLTDSHDADLVVGLINLDDVIMDTKGNILGGLDEQIDSIKQSKSYLFKPVKPNVEGTKPAENMVQGENQPIKTDEQLEEERFIKALYEGAGIEYKE